MVGTDYASLPDLFLPVNIEYIIDGRRLIYSFLLFFVHITGVLHRVLQRYGRGPCHGGL